MKRLTPIVLLGFAVTLAGCERVAKEKAPEAPAPAGVLHPQLTAEDGTWQAPAGTLGQTPAQPWSATTIEAAVNGKPLEGQIVERIGEIIDVSCYLQLGKHGAMHKDCATKCIRNGQPIGLLTENGELYLLMEEEHHPRRDGETNFREAIIPYIADIVKVTGTLSKVDGYNAIYVTGFLKPTGMAR